jgi:hypothetical protein
MAARSQRLVAGAGGLADAHSKSLRHHTTMKLLVVACYNLARKHETLKGNTPAMASGVSDHVWTIKELIEKAGDSDARN